MPPELIIRNGLVADGTGRPPFRAEVAIADGHIADIGTIPPDVEIPHVIAERERMPALDDGPEGTNSP